MAIPKAIKDKALAMIRSGDVTQREVMRQFGIGKTTIQTWLKEENPLTRENQRLKKENRELLALLGKVTLDMTRAKKNQLPEGMSPESEEANEGVENT